MDPVTDPTHPAVIVANLCTEKDDKPGFTLYVNRDVSKGEILGSLIGTIMLGSESDTSIRKEQDGKGKMREAALVDLEGSLQTYGGWVVGDRSEENANMLVLDTSKRANVLSLLINNWKYPLKSDSDEIRGAANVKLVQIRVNNLPKILVVATKDIEKNAELMEDMGKSGKEAERNIYISAKHLHDTQKMVNELTDKNHQLEADYNVVISKQVIDNKSVKSTRSAALHMVKEWKDMVEDNNAKYETVFPDGETTEKKHLGGIMSTHVIGSLRPDVYERRYDDDDELAEKVSEHQELIYDNDFMPKKPKEIEKDGIKKTIWVDNPDCEKATDIQEECGQEIYQEVGRAWLEVQDLRDETSGAQVPWNKNKKRMLDNDEIVMIQHAKCMILAGYKPSADTTTLTGEAASNRRKFRKIFKELKEQEEESDDDEDNAATAERAMGNC